MKNKLLTLIILAIGFSACNKEPQPLTRQEINQKIDSIVAYRVKELDDQYQRDLDHRIKIEVKVKADSIVNAAILHSNTDTSKKNKPALK